MAVDKLVDSAQLNADLTSVADAIRIKGGTSAQLTFPTGFVSAIDAIPTGGAGAISVVDTLDANGGTIRTITAVDISNDTVDAAHLAQGYTAHDASGQAIVGTFEPGYTPTQIFVGGANGVSGDIILTGSGKEYAFTKCSAITSVHGVMTGCPTNCFSNCTGIQKFFNTGHCWYGANCFANCTGMEYFIGTDSYDYYSSVFSNCSNLLAIDTEKFVTRAGSVCIHCGKLSKLIIRNSSAISPLYNTNVFTNTPFASGGSGGTIYIPKVLYDELGSGSSLDYKAATNWSTVDGYGTITWACIEGSIYEIKYADGTPIATT